MSSKRLKMVDDGIGSCTLNSSVPSGTYPPVSYLPHKARPSATRTRTFNSITRHRDWRRLEFVPSRFQRGERERECACLDRPHIFFLFSLFPRGCSSSSALFRLRDAQESLRARSFFINRRDDRFFVRTLKQIRVYPREADINHGITSFHAKAYLFRIVGVLSRVCRALFPMQSVRIFSTRTYICIYIYILRRNCVRGVFRTEEQRVARRR